MLRSLAILFIILFGVIITLLIRHLISTYYQTRFEKDFTRIIHSTLKLQPEIKNHESGFSKLLQEEINTLKKLQTRQLDIASSLGRVEYNLQLLELQKEQIIEDLENLKKEEEKSGIELSKKYGNGSIDIDQGIFTKTG